MAKTLDGDVAFQRASKKHECSAEDCKEEDGIQPGDRYFRVILNDARETVQKYHPSCYYRLFHEKDRG